MNNEYEVFDHKTQRVIATFHAGMTPELVVALEVLGYMVRPHEYNDNPVPRMS